ncbi:MAG: CPBP family intramembrane metalloprotease, partial [Lachnospiraceae bacterium]|nr:CPBP family intramembrane metalloprotease [Lachnospiraceae bacterium]
MNRNKVFTLYKKEMLDIFRDKKTMIIMVLVPLFLYPAMMLGTLLIMSNISQESLEKTYQVGIVASEEAEAVEALLLNEEDDYEYFFETRVYDDVKTCEQALIDGQIHAFIQITDGEDGRKIYEVGTVSSVMDSVTSGGYIKEILGGYRDSLRNDLLEEQFGDYEEILNPILIEGKDLATIEESAGSIFGYIIPFMLITSVLMGAVYPAIDVTAGERERGTLETMMTLPVKNSEMMFSKFMAVSTVAVMSAFLNLLSMFLMGLYMYDSMQLATTAFGDMNLLQFIPSVIALLVCMPIFAMFASAVCLSICIFAKSFKEANNYSTPILLVFMFASMAGMLPNITLDAKTSLIPIVNVSLFIKAVFELKFEWEYIVLVLLSNVVYSVVAVVLMSKLFSSEDVLFGEGFRGVHFLEKRSNMKPNQMPGIGDTVLMFGLLLLLMIYCSTSLVFRLGIWGTGLVQLIILAVPVCYAWYMKADFKKLFSLKVPKIKHVLGGICIWLGIWLLEQVVIVKLAEWFPSLVETSETLNSVIVDAGFVSAFIVVGICPAIAEEFAFRGFLFGVLKEKWKPWMAIVVSAVLFGAYHMNLLQFIGGAMMGIGLAYAAYASGSIWIGAIMHFINNGLSVIFQYHPELVEKIPILGQENYNAVDMVILIVVGIVFTALGILLLKKSKKA